jgi:hypothetical protein
MNEPEVPVRCVISIGMTRGDTARPRRHRPVSFAALPAAAQSPMQIGPDANCVIISDRLAEPRVRARRSRYDYARTPASLRAFALGFSLPRFYRFYRVPPTLCNRAA